MPRRRSPGFHPQILASEKDAGMARHHSPHIDPQIQPSETGAGAARRRSHPQIETGEDDARVTCPRSPRLHPQIEAGEDDAGVTRRIRRRCGAPPASPPDDDDMLREILIRLPPEPSSLPRASAVCKRWRGLVTDPQFLRQFHAHHRKPPLLGVFSRSSQGRAIVVTPILNPPDRIPLQRFNLGRCSIFDHGRPISGCDHYNLLDCRHGLVLVKNRSQSDIVVCDPNTSEQRRAAIPLEFKNRFSNGAVLCTAGDVGHLHGACHSRPFKVILVSTYTHDNRLLACVYSSETAIWGNLILTEAPCIISGKPPVLVGNCLYWMCALNDILEFDLGQHRLTVIRGPPAANDMLFQNRLVIKAEDGAIGYAILYYLSFQMWQKNVNCHGVTIWVPWKTVEMHSILKPPPQTDEEMAFLGGYDDDTDVIFLSVSGNIYMVQLKSMESRKLYETALIVPPCYHPFKSFYTPGITNRGCDEADSVARCIG